VDSDKRRATRVPVGKGTRGQLKSTIAVSILNVSETGILFEVASTLRPGSTYDLTAKVAGIMFSGLVRVTRCRAGVASDNTGGRSLVYQAGGEFVGLSEQQTVDLRIALSNSKRIASGVTLRRHT
jgi:hypothetical protein